MAGMLWMMSLQIHGLYELLPLIRATTFSGTKSYDFKDVDVAVCWTVLHLIGNFAMTCLHRMVGPLDQL